MVPISSRMKNLTINASSFSWSPALTPGADLRPKKVVRSDDFSISRGDVALTGRSGLVRAGSMATAAVMLGALLGGCQQAPQPRSLTLWWTAPTHHTDGSPLNAIPSYTIHYGNQSRALGAYPVTREVGTPACTNRGGDTQCSYVWEDTSFGQNCFSVTATVPVDNRSDYSGEVCVTIAAPSRGGGS